MNNLSISFPRVTLSCTRRRERWEAKKFCEISHVPKVNVICLPQSVYDTLHREIPGVIAVCIGNDPWSNWSAWGEESSDRADSPETKLSHVTSILRYFFPRSLIQIPLSVSRQSIISREQHRIKQTRGTCFKFSTRHVFSSRAAPPPRNIKVKKILRARGPSRSNRVHRLPLALHGNITATEKVVRS